MKFVSANFYLNISQKSEIYHSRDMRISLCFGKISHFAKGGIYHCNAVNLRVDSIAYAGEGLFRGGVLIKKCSFQPKIAPFIIKTPIKFTKTLDFFDLMCYTLR